MSFTNITFNAASQTLAPFAFVAPQDATPVCITSPSLQRLNYQSPVDETTWTPQPVAQLVNNPNMGGAAPQVGAVQRKDWRTRAAEEHARVPRRRAARAPAHLVA